MKNKGFTLIELLAVIVVIGIVSMVAIPGIMSISNKIKNGNIIDDAKKLVALAKYKVNKENILASRRFSFDELNVNGDLEKDPDGKEYKTEYSYVEYSIYNDLSSYCVVLIGSKRAIGGYDDCIPEEALQPDMVVDAPVGTPRLVDR